MRTWIGSGLVGLCFLALALTLAPAPMAQAADPPQGQKVFEAQKCNMCHPVSTAGIEATTKSEKMKASDLVNLGEKRDAKWLGQYLRKEVQIEGADHKKEFKGSDEELQALVDWLLEQKAEG